jgi:hypothetical protein
MIDRIFKVGKALALAVDRLADVYVICKRDLLQIVSRGSAGLTASGQRRI